MTDVLISHTNSTGLHQALRSCNFEDIKSVLERDNSEVNVIDQRLGWSPLYKAVMYGDIKIVQLLLSMGANPNQPNKVATKKKLEF